MGTGLGHHQYLPENPRSTVLEHAEIVPQMVFQPSDRGGSEQESVRVLPHSITNQPQCTWTVVS